MNHQHPQLRFIIPPPGRCFSHCILIKILLSSLDIPAPWVRIHHTPYRILFTPRDSSLRIRGTSNIDIQKLNAPSFIIQYNI